MSAATPLDTLPPPRLAQAAASVRPGALLAVLAPPGADALPPTLDAWAGRFERRVRLTSADEVLYAALRTRPTALLVDWRDGAPDGAAAETCRRIKADSFTGIVPVIALAADGAGAAAAAFTAGADEVLGADAPAWEVEARLDALLRRSARDLGVHPTTRLPGTPEIEADIARRLADGAPFAACYADLDHFKEFNDRYGYNEGDRVIRVVARLLHDVVKGVAGETGFVGHIGGDDFLFVVPLDHVGETCGTIVETFELLVPYQYSEADRRAGYYLGKDRRGQLHRVPLMSLSIGVATNERRRFTHASQMSGMASEMKSYAKAQPGSLFAVDRRTDDAGPTSRLGDDA
ncbi:diguanylate cyclase [Roseisolibacter sp. H3M3-2]|uniref:GGDEF domain-containing protein n=1 Tax=Roseisolibacter sp. H3M3-2 TaxID=3031323 RepID=UPI0023DBD042|nr:diguanylate cyclase [Roseisolibacter sp. H3M3-2]MDF1506166.1 diguanylate cyclase [Roseisolibacter sp. H3M3-2]